MAFYDYNGNLLFDEKPLDGLKLSLLGDSISAYVGTVPEGNTVSYRGNNIGVSSPDQMWWSVLCQKTGMEPLIIDGWSGSGITPRTNSSATAMCSDLRTGRLHSGSVNPDIILIAGGVNDYSYATEAQNEPLAWDGHSAPDITASFTEAYACMIKKLQTNYPLALVVALSTWFTMRGDNNGYTNTHTVGSNVYTQADYNQAIEDVAKIMHIPFIAVDNIGMNRANMYPTYAVDNSTTPTHPNATGQKLMGEYIANVLPVIAASFSNSL